MKYAILAAADQTIIYLASKNEFTTDHKQALLFDTMDKVEEAVMYLSQAELKPLILVDSAVENNKITNWDNVVFFERVEDENEFRSRKNTW